VGGWTLAVERAVWSGGGPGGGPAVDTEVRLWVIVNCVVWFVIGWDEEFHFLRQRWRLSFLFFILLAFHGRKWAYIVITFVIVEAESNEHISEHCLHGTTEPRSTVYERSFGNCVTEGSGDAHESITTLARLVLSGNANKVLISSMIHWSQSSMQH
jgi:hypothetical protein